MSARAWPAWGEWIRELGCVLTLFYEYTILQAIMANVKLTDIVRKYVDCDTSGDFADWIERLELVAALQKTEDSLASILPLLLDGPAFAVYKQMPEDTRKDYEKVKKGILTAFGVDCYAAYEEFRNRVLREGESVDVFLSDLKRLAMLIGVEANAAKPIVKCAFVAVLPVDVKSQLKSAVELEKLELNAVATRARVILSTRGNGDISCASGAPRRVRGSCYACGKVGHMAKDCPSRHADSMHGRRAHEKVSLTCYACGQRGHIAKNCEGPLSAGKGQGGVSAPDISSASQ